MTLALNTCKQLIKEGKIPELFVNQLNWEPAEEGHIELSTQFAETTYTVSARPVAQKRGFVICLVDAGRSMPAKPVRQKLRMQLARHYYEHILIWRDDSGNQIWMATVKRQNKPIRIVETECAAGQEPEALLQKLDGVIFSLQEEGALTVTDVVERVEQQFSRNAENVTRQFYEKFRTHLTQFQEFITGLGQQVDREQYAALMLNRLMFIYFIQSRGFLDNDRNYLNNRLQEHRNSVSKKGETFYTSFYRHFLMTLFHSALGTPEALRDTGLRERIGQVPYLNGGLFDTHQLEQQYQQKLDIKDEAFEKLFEFFDQYNWHLDDRPAASGQEINPDVIGHIFEKYINDRASMGAYYTQEDITGYIARNTILPHLLRQAKKNCEVAFHHSTGTIWRMLRKNPDRYIHEPVRKGNDKPDTDLPDDIAIGLDTGKPDLLKRRQKWNTTADSGWGLPTETWREALTRRERCLALKEKITNGSVTDITGLITDNLDIEKLAQDFLNYHEGADLITAFYTAIAGRQKMENSNAKEQCGITVLDPACGSGAFLFAALNILQPLYQICIERMQGFVAEDDERIKNKKQKNKRHLFFRAILKDIENHASEEYWIYRSIILNNLFGVDIMPEAAEVAKLRLFLKLAAAAEVDSDKPNMGLEPLPDIDFNIRAGNSLVGFVNMKDFEEYTAPKLSFDKKLIPKVKAKAKNVGMAYHRFIDAQTTADINTQEFKENKKQLREKLNELTEQLNLYLSYRYGKGATSEETNQWKQSHQPFHWFAEFYGIMENGGFDVVIGNPPYIKKNDVSYLDFSDNQFDSPDIYGHMIKSSFNLTKNKGLIGMIVMHSLAFSGEFKKTRELISDEAGKIWCSWYGRIPSGLFISNSNNNPRVRNCIFLAEKSSGNREHYTTRLHRWNTKERLYLFNLLSYVSCDINEKCIPMFNNENENKIFSNMRQHIRHIFPKNNTELALYFKKAAYNYISISPSPPPCFNAEGRAITSTKVGSINISDSSTLDLLLLLFSGRLFFSFWLTYGDDFDVINNTFQTFYFPIKNLSIPDKNKLKTISNEYKGLLDGTIQFKLNAGKRIGSYNTSKLWHITDKSDLIFIHYLADNPEIVLDSVQTHIQQTINKKTNNNDA